MKVILIAVVALALSLIVPAPVRCQGCGLQPLKPLPPLGCKDLIAQCVLDVRPNPSA